MSRSTVAHLALGLAAFAFGATFVVVKDAMDSTSPLAFVGWRFLVGGLVLVAIRRPATRSTWVDGSIAGVLLFVGYALQTTGLTTSSASNSGLITGLYVVFTPLLAAAISWRAPGWLIMTGAVLSFAGLAVLTTGDGFALGSGDLYTLGCAAAFAGHIVYLSRRARHHPVIAFTAVQLLVTAVLGLVGSWIVDGPGLPSSNAWPAIVALGLVVSAGAFYLQVWAQTVIGPARTAIVLALEPAFAALTGAVVLGERLGPRGITGAVLILGGIYVVLAGTEPDDELPVGETISAAH